MPWRAESPHAGMRAPRIPWTTAVARGHAGAMDPMTPPPELARLFNKAGDLVSMPVKAPLRRQLLTWIASTLPTGRDLTEVEINACLRPIDDDVATLRRYLIDHDLIERPEPGVYRVLPQG